MKTPKQTFSSPQIPYRASSIRLLPSDVTSIQLPPVGPSNSVFSSTHSSFRLDKVNSDMCNYITNFAADLRWIQAQRHPSAYLSVAAMLQWSDVGVRWLEQTLKTSQWEFTRGSQRILAKNEALFNTHCIWCHALLYSSVLLPIYRLVTFTASFRPNLWAFLPSGFFGCWEGWYYFANTHCLASALQDGLWDF